MYSYVSVLFQDDGYTVHSFVLSCSVGPSFVWVPRFLIIYIYRLIMLVVAGAFAYLVRHVRITPLNDSKFVAVFIPIAVGVSFVGNLSGLLLHQRAGVNTPAAFLSTFIFVSAVLLCSVLFIPTVLHIVA